MKPILPNLLIIMFLASATSSIAAATKQEMSPQLAEIMKNFSGESIQVSGTLVDCTLSQGTKTQCVKITVPVNSADHNMGPWCPRKLTDTKEKAGIWIDSEKIYDVDGKFIENLSSFYQDKQWKMYDAGSGKINVTESREACLAAARPDVDPTYNNYCVECSPSFVEDTTPQSYLIPVQPKISRTPERVSPRGGVGLALNGVKLEASAPLHAILGAHTLAPFDDCGGHVNPHVGYHYHAVMGCGKSGTLVAGHGRLIGLAMDGFGIYSPQSSIGSAVSDLDTCGGHDAGKLGYHYHAGEADSNKIIGCFIAEQGCVVERGQSDCSLRKEPPPR